MRVMPAPFKYCTLHTQQYESLMQAQTLADASDINRVLLKVQPWLPLQALVMLE